MQAASLGRAWGRVRRPPPVYVVLALVFVVLRLAVVLSVRRSFGDFPDSSTYRPAATGPEYSYVSLVGNAMRPFTVPLLYAVLPDDGARVAAQAVLSVAAWLTLAGVTASVLRDARVRVAGFVAILLFGSTYLVTTWDLAILSESLTISLGVLAVAAWLRLAARPGPWSATAVLVTTAMWMFTRSQAFALVVVLALVTLLWSLRRADRAIKLTVGIGLALVAVWGFASVQNQEQVSAARDGRGVGIFSETFALNLRFRILPDPAATAWFAEQGMPSPVGLEGHRRASLADDDWAGWPAFFDAYRTNTALTRWVDDHGQATLARWALAHPATMARQFGGDLPDLLVPERASLAYVDSPRPLGPVDALLTPSAGSGIPGMPVLWLVVACAILVARAPRRRVALRPLVVGGALVALSVAGIFLGWFGSPVEFARHALPFTLFLPIGLVVVVLVLTDAVVHEPAPGGTPDPSPPTTRAAPHPAP